MTTWQPQGPADRCVIDGRNMGWLNCTPTSTAMGIDWASDGEFRPSGCTVRRRMEDTVGGTTLAQAEPIVEEYGIVTDRRTSWRAATPGLVANRLSDNWGGVLQGNTGVLIGTRHQSTSGYVNHAVWFQPPGYDWGLRNGLWRPDSVDVYDPAADGRHTFAQGPQRWSWATLMRFAAALRPNGDSDPSTIGPGKAWVLFLEQLPSGWRAGVKPGESFWLYTLAGDYIVSRERQLTRNGFSAKCAEPGEYRVHSSVAGNFPQDDYDLVKLLSGSRAGKYIGRQYAREV